MVRGTAQGFVFPDLPVTTSMEDLRILDDDTTSITVRAKTPPEKNRLLPVSEWSATLSSSDEIHSVPITFPTLHRCNLHQQMRIASANSANNATVKKYMDERLKVLGNQWFDNGDILLQMLRSCDALISGDVALQFLLPERRTRWYPVHLHLYVSTSYHISMYRQLEMHGYKIINERVPNYWTLGHSTVAQTATFARSSRLIKVTVSTTTAPSAPIFEQESTALMNFISHDRVYCAYPTLTFHGIAMINPGLLYTGMFCIENVQTSLRYRRRGFLYTSCHHNTGISVPCPSVTRAITDSSGMWWDLKRMEEIHSSPRHFFERFGVVDCHWTLGGPICGCPHTLVLPEVRVVQDESYVFSMCAAYATLTNSQLALFIMVSTSSEANIQM